MGKVVEYHVEFQRVFILMVVLDVHGRILLAEHGDKLVVAAILERQIEFSHDTENILDVTGIVFRLRQGAAD